MNGSQEMERLLDLWWVEPGRLAGMPVPLIASERRENPNAPLSECDDDLLTLDAVGIRAVVGLLNIPVDAHLYRSAGFEHLLLPIPDGGAPSVEQFAEFMRFVRAQLAADRPTAVHCAAGLGRTGTLLAGYLIANGASPDDAMRRIRHLRRGAIETSVQVHFLRQLPAVLRSGIDRH